MVIAIGGVSRSGKTKLTKILSQYFEDKDMFTICQDDYAYPISEIPMIKELTDWECPESINYEVLKKDLIDAISNHSHVIVEGFLAFHYKALNKYYDKSIFITIDRQTFFERRLRDTRWEIEPNWYVSYVWESYLKHGQLPEQHNCLIIDGTSHLQINKVLEYLNINE